MESEQIRACVPDALVSALYGHLMEDRPWDGVLRQLMAHTDSAVAGLGCEPVRVCGPAGIGDLLFCNCLGDVGVHGSSLSMESWFATAIRMN